MPDASGNFWTASHLPLFMLAPMEDVTDTAFREVVLRNTNPGALNVVFTEFTSTDGLCHPRGREATIHRLYVSESECTLLREKGVKIVAQIWGKNPANFYDAVRMISEEMAFDGIDINMGCPVRKVVANGCGSALIDDEPLAAEIIAATREATSLPVSVKTRLGVKKVDTERWISFLLEQPLDGIILHGRIQKQMSEGDADWNEIARAVAIRNSKGLSIPIIGNGDVFSLEQAYNNIEKYGTDGVMIGRGIFSNPWLFAEKLPQEISIQKRVDTLLTHINLFEKKGTSIKVFPVLKRFFKIYISGFNGAAELRSQLMQTSTPSEAKNLLNNFIVVA